MKFLRTGLAVFLSAAALLAHAQDYPNKPVRIVIPYAAGGGVDAAARLVAQSLSASLGQSFIVDARPGGGTAIGTDAVARSAADGYTLLITGGSTMSLLPMTHAAKLPFDPLTDFAPIGMVSRMPFFLATSSTLPYQSVNELFKDVKAKPDQLAYASNGIGAMAHLGTEMLVQAAGAKMIHVPYAGFTPALTDVVAGRVSIVMADLGALNGQLQAGTLRPLAVASKERSRFMPNVPTLVESGYPDAQFEVWLALYAPAKTPREVLTKVGKALSTYLATPAAREAFAKLGHESDPSGAEVVRKRPIEEQKAFLPAVRAAGLDKKQ